MSLAKYFSSLTPSIQTSPHCSLHLSCLKDLAPTPPEVPLSGLSPGPAPSLPSPFIILFCPESSPLSFPLSLRQRVQSCNFSYSSPFSWDRWVGGGGSRLCCAEGSDKVHLGPRRHSTWSVVSCPGHHLSGLGAHHGAWWVVSHSGSELGCVCTSGPSSQLSCWGARQGCCSFCQCPERGRDLLVATQLDQHPP